MKIGSVALTLAAVCAGKSRIEMMFSNEHYDDIGHCLGDEDWEVCYGEEDGEWWLWSNTEYGEHEEYFEEAFICGYADELEYCWACDMNDPDDCWYCVNNV